MWRLLIGLGCVPAAVALYFRLTIPETPRFTMDIERNVDQASADIEKVIFGKEKRVNEDAQIQRIQVPKASWADFRYHFGQMKNFKILFAASYSWFALDVHLKLLLFALRSSLSPQIAFYGLGLNSGIILQTIGFGGPFSSNAVIAVYENLKAIAIGNLILSAAGLIPGYYAAFLLIDSWGRKPIQLMGFIVLTILFIIMGMCPHSISVTSFFI
jgi:PHS family inorganic phosphate transporter-like MFS transporter